MAEDVTRLAGAVQSIREAVAAASRLPLDSIGPDEDLVSDLSLDELELESLSLIVEEVFAVRIPEELYRSPLYRTAASLAEWVIRQSNQASWSESQRQRKRA